MSDNANSSKSSSKSESSRGSNKEHSIEDVEDGEASGELTTQEQAAAKRIADWAGVGKRSGCYELNLLFLLNFLNS